jgi:hypothetical protein
MASSTLAPSNLDDRGAVLSALRGLGGRATVAEVVAATGLDMERARTALRGVVETHRGHLEATDDGELVYAFPGGIVPRDHVPLPLRLWRGAKRGALAAFKVWTVLMLAGYSILFALLAVVLLVALVVKSDGDGWEGGAEILWLPLRVLFEVWFWFGIPGLPEGRAPRKLRGHTRGVPIPERLFRFLVGPPDPSNAAEARNRRAAGLVRSRRGVLAALDLVLADGLGPEEAQEELARLAVALGGDFEVSPGGEVVSVFPGMVVDASAIRGGGREVRGGRESAPPSRYLWERGVPSPPFSGNPAGTDAWIVGGNLFNLAASALVLAGGVGLTGAAAALFGALVGPVATLFLGWIPFTFSALFLSIPLLRLPGWRRRREAALGREATGAVLQALTAAGGEGTISLESLARRHPRLDPRRLGEALERVSAWFGAEVEETPAGEVLHRFSGPARTLREVEEMRARLALDRRQLGEVVYSSGDDAATAARRELDAFDRALERPERGLPPVDGGSGERPGS